MTKLSKPSVFLGLVSLMIVLTSTNVEMPSRDTNFVAIRALTKEHIFGDDRPFAQGHASTVVETNDHKYLVAWFGGTHEKHDDVGIWLSKGRPSKWSRPIEVAKIREDPHWNPVLFKTSSGEIILYFKVGKVIDAWETWFITSSNNGESWSSPQELVKNDKGGRGPVRNKPIVLSNGSWIAGASNEKKGIWNAFVDRSEDQGLHWTASQYLRLDRRDIVGEGVIQPTLWESSPGNVHMLLRSSSGYICRSDSPDYGKTWSKIYKTSLPNPNSGIDVTKLSDGRLALVYNKDNKNWGERTPLSLAISADNGKTWPTQLDIENGVKGDEFSYPAVISVSDTVIVTYTWKRQNIAIWAGIIE
ncbi:MAG: sialidase family protein [Chryseolinea sp.]